MIPRAGRPACCPMANVIAPVGARQGRQESLRLAEQDFDGKEVWSLVGNERDRSAGWRHADQSLRQHHDWQRADLPCGLLLTGIHAGARRAPRRWCSTHVDRTVPAISDRLLQDDHLMEYGADGKIRGNGSPATT